MRDLLRATEGQPIDAARLTALRQRVDASGVELGNLAAAAPDDGARASVRGAEESLRGYLFALEAEQLLRDGATAPSAEALERADATRRSHAGALDDSLTRIDAILATEPAPPAPPTT